MMKIQDNSTISICFVIGSLNIGGAEKQLILLANGLSDLGYKVSIFALNARGLLLPSISDNICLLDGGYRNKHNKIINIISILFSFIKFAIYLNKNRTDNIYSFLPLSNFFTVLIGKSLKISTIITGWRSVDTGLSNSSMVKKIMAIITFRFSDFVVCNSIAVSKQIEKKMGSNKKIKIIYNAIQLADENQINSEKLRSSLCLHSKDIGLVYVANLIPYKGHFDLINAFYLLQKKEDRVKLFLIGEDRGIQRDLEQKIKNLDIEKKVVFLGQVQNVACFLSIMDVGVMASHIEGFSNALLEKLHIGLPVVATDVGGNRELIQNITGCVIVKPKDRQDLYTGLLKIIKDLENFKKTRLQRKNYIINNFSLEIIIKQHEDIFWSERLSKIDTHSGKSSE